MGWFTKDNDEDIDDIYNKLDDIYQRLEALDAVNAFSSRLSRLEKTSSYLENVLIETVKDIEKRVDKLETVSTMPTIEKGSISEDASEVIQEEIQTIKIDLKSLKKTVSMLDDTSNSSSSETSNDAVMERINDLDEVIKNLSLKVSYFEVTNSKSNNNADEISALKEEVKLKNEKIEELTKKIESVSYIIDEDNKNIKMVAKYIIDQANTIKALKEDIKSLKQDR